jgi:hypothetical protein
MVHRHPTDAERQQMRDLVDAIGAAEVLRVIGSIIANDHPDLSLGQQAKETVFKVAKDLSTFRETAK